MNHKGTKHEPHWLVPIYPELVVSASRDKGLVIEKATPRVAQWIGCSAEELVGRPLADVFRQAVPGLYEVAEDVLTSAIPVRDYKLSFKDFSGQERTALINASLRHLKGRSSVVVIRMEEVAKKRALPKVAPRATEFHGMVGGSEAMLKVFGKIEIYGPADAPVLVTGETGTGKELAARALHEKSRRRNGPFVAVNCSALSRDILESELFGHEKGAFTGAIRLHRGRFERASGGTIFLDEIGEIPPSIQAVLLRVLEEGAIERVGGEHKIPVDVRIIAATNQPLEWAVTTGRFREDLYHRLAVLRIHMPPLRDRPEDIPFLVDHFLEHFNKKYGRRIVKLTKEAMAFLKGYPWPGNVRELRNVLERVYLECRTDVIGRRAFDEWVSERSLFAPGGWGLASKEASAARKPPLITPYPSRLVGARYQLPYMRSKASPAEGPMVSQEESIVRDREEDEPIDVEHFTVEPARELTEERIREAFKRTAGNITQASRILGIHKATFYRKMKALGLTRQDLEAEI